MQFLKRLVSTNRTYRHLSQLHNFTNRETNKRSPKLMLLFNLKQKMKQNIFFLPDCTLILIKGNRCQSLFGNHFSLHALSTFYPDGQHTSFSSILTVGIVNSSSLLSSCHAALVEAGHIYFKY